MLPLPIGRQDTGDNQDRNRNECENCSFRIKWMYELCAIQLMHGFCSNALEKCAWVVFQRMQKKRCNTTNLYEGWESLVRVPAAQNHEVTLAVCENSIIDGLVYITRMRPSWRRSSSGMKNECYCVWYDVSRFLGLEWLAWAKRVQSRDTTRDVTARENTSKFYEMLSLYGWNIITRSFLISNKWTFTSSFLISEKLVPSIGIAARYARR